MTNLRLGPGSRVNSMLHPPGTPRGVHGMSAEDLTLDIEKGSEEVDEKVVKTKTKRTWYGRKRTVVIPELEEGVPEPRPPMLYAPVYNGLAFGLSVCECYASFIFLPLTHGYCAVFLANGVNTILIEWQLDRDFTRFALCATIPLLFAVSLVSSLPRR